ncbi:MAG: type II toxin-antitoxin system prevent-host-death family antitoxin [Pseudomonadota bacterium]
MKTVGLFEAKTHLSALIEAVQRGETITITKRGKPVAKLVGHGEDAEDERERRRAAIERVREIREDFTLGGLDWKALRDEGKR